MASCLLKSLYYPLVPSEELAHVGLLRKWENQTPTALPDAGGCLELAVSQGDFLTGLSALGESSLKSRSKSKGQMASWPEAPPRKAGSQRSHGQPHQRLPFPLGEPLRARARGSQPGLPLGECPSFPFSHLGASGTLGKLRDFSNAKRKHISLHCIE